MSIPSVDLGREQQQVSRRLGEVRTTRCQPEGSGLRLDPSGT